MTQTALVDANILIDGPDFGDASLSSLRQLQAQGWDLIVNPIMLAETVTEFATAADQYDYIDAAGLRVEPLPPDASYPAGHAFQLYRERGGRKSQTLPDFLIGAQALIDNLGIFARDPKSFRYYSPSVNVITFETPPL